MLFGLVGTSHDRRSPAQLKLEVDWIKATWGQETENAERQGNIFLSFLQQLLMKFYNNAEPQVLHCTGNSERHDCNHIQLSIRTRLLFFFYILCLPPRTPYEKQMFSQNRQSCLSGFLSPSCFCCVCGQSCAYRTFPGRLWNPLAVLIWNAKTHSFHCDKGCGLQQSSIKC